MTESEKRAFLSEIPLFSCLDFSTLSLDAREVFLSPDESYEVKSGLAVLVSGRVDIYKREALMKSLLTPSVIGFATLFSNSDTYISTIVSLTNTRLLVLSEEFVSLLISKSPEFSKRLIVLLTEKIRYLNRRIDFYTSSSAESKLYEFLIASANSEGFVEMPMLKLSELLGIGRASLYRAINTLEEKGVIEKQGKKIFLIK